MRPHPILVPRLPAHRRLPLAALSAAVAALAACGGGSVEPGPATPPPPASARTIEGTAAIGAALAHAQVQVTDAAGHSACQESTIATDAQGRYRCTLVDGERAPFVVVVTDPSGAHDPLVSAGTATPQAGAAAVVNATPLTNAIVAQLAPDRSPLTLAAQPATLDGAALDAATTQVLAQLAPVLAALEAPADFDPFSTRFSAATADGAGDAADGVIAMLRFTVVDGAWRVATVDAPDAAIALAAPGANASALAAPSADAARAVESLKFISRTLQQCFALPMDERVLAVDTSRPADQGGPFVSQSGCGQRTPPITTDDFQQNGFFDGQFFYGLLTDDAMTGASFEPPELLRYARSDNGADTAVINLRYVDAKGVAGSIITVAKRVPGSNANGRGSDWWLYGNQTPVDVSVRASLRRREQLAPNPGTGTFASAATSRFEAALNIFIDKDGPRSGGMRAVRVTGPGLPTAGLVYTRPDPALALSQNWMNIARKDGNTDPAAATYAGNVGNVFILQRTMGLDGDDATAVRPNPNAGSANNTQYLNWAHPLDYGQAPGSTGYVDFGRLGAWTSYHFEVFYDGEAAPRYTFDKSLLTPVVPATQGAAQPWVDLAGATRGYLDPADALAASTTRMTLAWTANPLAPTIASAGVYTGDASGPSNQGLVSVAHGATEATATAPTRDGNPVPFRALTADGQSYRQIQIRYRTLDGSYRDTITQYN